MNWKAVGLVLLVGGFLVAGAGFFAGELADMTVSLTQKADWAVQCFKGYADECGDFARHKAFVDEWRQRGLTISVLAGMLALVGGALRVGARKEGPPEVPTWEI